VFRSRARPIDHHGPQSVALGTTQVAVVAPIGVTQRAGARQRGPSWVSHAAPSAACAMQVPLVSVATAVKQSASMHSAREPSASVPQAAGARTYATCWQVLAPAAPKQASPRLPSHAGLVPPQAAPSASADDVQTPAFVTSVALAPRQVENA
jgi:hypothetical protein